MFSQVTVRASLAATVFAFLLGAAHAGAATTPQPILVLPKDVKWVAGTGADKGTSSALLAGDPSKPGMYVLLVKVPAGWSELPNYHNQDEYAMVIEGTVLLGFGDVTNESAMNAMPAGSFSMIPKHVHHYAIAKTAATFEVFGVGPITSTPVTR